LVLAQLLAWNLRNWGFETKDRSRLVSCKPQIVPQKLKGGINS
jgi:hypothetical protein